MMTTALSLGRPYSLPFDNEQFYFMPTSSRCISRTALSRGWSRNPGDAKHGEPRARRGDASVRLPAVSDPRNAAGRRGGANEPVVSACCCPGCRCIDTRGRVDRGKGVGRDAETEPTAERTRIPPGDETSEVDAAERRSPCGRARFVAANVRKVVFSDGGICSNFPVHMFDAVLPGWPTFGINLRDDLRAGSGDDERAYLPQRGTSLPPEEYTIAASGAEGIISFATAIVRTMQNWRDNLQRAAPGFRDRVVTIRHTPAKAASTWTWLQATSTRWRHRATRARRS